jgi:hypothetical protein
MLIFDIYIVDNFHVELKRHEAVILFSYDEVLVDIAAEIPNYSFY